MKKTALLLLLGCATLAKAQPYGEWSWHDHDLQMTSASYNLNIPGHLMAGHYIHGLNYGKFKLFKVDQSGTVIFDEQYEVHAQQQCQPGPAAAVADGVDAIETSSPTEPYAVSGAVDGGCFFITFDASGIVQTTRFFNFPVGPMGIRPGQTSLTEVPVSLGGGFLITGSYMGLVSGKGHRIMYILRLDPMGNLIQSRSYHNVVTDFCHDKGHEFKPSTIIVSPYTPNQGGQPEIVVVGEAIALGSPLCSNAYVQHSEAFFMRLNFNTLNYISNWYYRHSANPLIAEQNDFKSIVPTAVGVQNLFILGGYSETSPTANDRAMMMLVDAIGTPQWSYIYNSSYSDTRACMQVGQRVSPTYGQTFYGGVISVSAGLLGIKVDATGIPFTTATPIDNYNEFNYQSGLNGNPFSDYETCGLSIEPNPGSSEGIHVYGTAGTVMNWEMVKASFNGVAATTGLCNNSTVNNQLTILAGPHAIYDDPINPTPGLNNCPFISVTQTSFASVNNLLCSTSTPIAGVNSNNRPTGINENSEDGRFSVSPNPARNQISLELPSSLVSPSLKVTDLSGRTAGEISLMETLDSSATYDLTQLTIPNGVYLIEVPTASGKIFTKFVLQR